MLTADPQALVAAGFEPVDWHGQTAYAKPGQWVVRLNGLDGTPAEQVRKAEAKLNRQALKVSRHLGDDGLLLLESDKGKKFAEVKNALKRVRGFALVEPDFALSASAVPNDPYFAYEWGLNNTGQTGGTPDADIDAPEAWDLSTGAAGTPVVTGVIDSGIDYTHPDLQPNMWRNPGEVGGAAGIDDDGNGYVDDVYGYDFFSNDSDPYDDNGHGTHVAGTVAAAGNNGTGVAGVNYHGQLMALKFLGADGSGSLSGAVAAINYATRMRQVYGVNIGLTNNSWGGGGYSQTLYDAIKAHGDAGLLFVAAAGNGGSDGVGDNNDLYGNYPSNSDLPNVIAVAATDQFDGIGSFSNYGATTVDLAAPGVDVASTYPGGRYVYMSGTSMAAPHVSGAAALALSYNPGATAAQVKQAILGGADPVASMSGKSVTGGRLNLLKTLHGVAATAPAAPSSLLATASVTNGRIDLAWVDGSDNEQQFLIERSSGGGAFVQIAAVGADITSYADTGLADSTTYAYRVRASNSAGASAYSNEASATTAQAPTRTAPAAPSSLSAGAVSSSRIDLYWLDNSTDEDGFLVQRSTNGGEFVNLGTLPANTTAAANTGLADSAMYTYRIFAYNGAGYSDASNTATATTPAAPGDGLAAVYYNNMDFTGATASRVDPYVNFNWGKHAPIGGFGSDTFSVRWTGYVRPEHSQTYTFYTRTDDGVRLWVNGQLLIDQWYRVSSDKEHAGSITLTGGQKYTIRMDYFEYSRNAVAGLAWSSPSTPKQVIPQSRLYSGQTTMAGLAAGPAGVKPASPFATTPIRSASAGPDAITTDLETADLIGI